MQLWQVCHGAAVGLDGFPLSSLVSVNAKMAQASTTKERIPFCIIGLGYANACVLGKKTVKSRGSSIPAQALTSRRQMPGSRAIRTQEAVQAVSQHWGWSLQMAPVQGPHDAESGAPVEQIAVFLD